MMPPASASASTATLHTNSTGGSGPSSHSPLGVLLVSKDESAERILFMYPFQPELQLSGKFITGDDEDSKSNGGECKEGNRGEDGNVISSMLDQQNGGDNDAKIEARIFGLPVKMLAPLLQTKGHGADGDPFEIKVDNIRFAGFPWRIESCGSLCLAVIFILSGSADSHIVEAFQRLSKKIAIAINTEQQRCNYLRDQICLMQPAHDEFEALPDEQRKGRHHAPYEAILAKSGLAKHLRDIFEDVCEYGMVDVFVDDCIEIGFCVEPKALCHAGLAPRSSHQVEMIMARIRPYHSILFLEDSVPSPDSNPFVLRFLEEYEPSRSIEELALLSGLPLSQVLQIVRHYLLWARAMVIYPICTSNVYANSDRLPASYKMLEAMFAEQFAECQLAEVLEAFSSPCSLGSFLQDTAIYLGQPSMHMSMLVFLLRNQLLVQLHTYFYLLPPASNFEQAQSVVSGQQNGGGAVHHGNGMERASNGVEQEQSKQLMSARLRTCVNASKELDGQMKAHILGICARAMHSVGIAEAEMFWLANTFLTFIPYLNGRNHIEDIIYRTQLDRSTIARVLDTYSDLICPLNCQDLIVEDE